MKIKNTIFIKDWLVLKPYEKQTETDNYYLKICNKVKNQITQYSELFEEFDLPDGINHLSCFLTSYFEDIISESNIWNSFVKAHKRLYNKPLPFYDVSEYFEEEINIQDVTFLIWYFFNNIQQERFVSPYNPIFFDMAFNIMDVFDDEYEFAPENKHLQSFYTIDKNETDFYIARALIDNILFNSYLFYFDTFKELMLEEADIIEEANEEYLISILQENHNNLLLSLHTRLLAFKGQDWAAEIVGKNHPLHNDYLNISKRIVGYFFYKGQDDENIFLEHIASGKKFNLTKKSFDHSDSLKEIDSFIYMGIVLWQNEWWFSGVFFTTEFNADIVLDEKNSVEHRRMVSFLDDKSKIYESLEDEYKAFKEFSGGSQIVFLKVDKIDNYIRNYIEYFNKSLKLSEKAKAKAIKRIKKEGLLDIDTNNTSYLTDLEDAESGLVFFNPKSGIEIAVDINSAFPSPENPFYNEQENEEAILKLFMNESYSTELVKYNIDNFKNEIPFFKKPEGQFFLENADFLLRFFKRGYYHTEPQITLI